jgi:hypothetical protein
LDERSAAKHGDIQHTFIRRCIDFGAEVVETTPVATKVLIIPQETYAADSHRYIDSSIQTTRKIGYMTLAWAGLQDDFIDQFDIKKIFLLDKDFFDFLLKHRGDASVFNGRELVEVGIPYEKYPVFPEFQTDYLLAIPTPFSFPHEKDKWHFLETLLRLFRNIGPDDAIVHKAHNASSQDYFCARKHRVTAQLLKPFFGPLMEKSFKGRFSESIGMRESGIGKLYTAFLYETVMNRVTPMQRLTQNHSFAMEAFLPGVRKGVIGGLSNTIWGSLFFKLPYYNCVDIQRQSRSAESKLYKKDPSELLDLNLKFFHVPYCQGKLHFENNHFSIVAESTRQGDLIEELRKEVRLSS